MSASGALVVALLAALGAADYDAFCDRDGNVTTEQHGRGLIALVQDRDRLEAVHADAAKGNPRAAAVFRMLEADYFPDYGRDLADLVSQPPCLVPALRELSGWCVPRWEFLSFLSKDKPGGTRLRKALFDGYAERLRQRGLENQLILSAMNALLGVGVAATTMGAESAASTAPRVALDTNAVIARLEGAPLDLQAVVKAIAGRRPSVSITAVKEFLRGGGDVDALRRFLVETGGDVGKAPAPALLRQLIDLGLKPGDARVVGSAMEEGIPVLTRDKRILRRVPHASEGF